MIKLSVDRFSWSRLPKPLTDLFRCLCSQSSVCSYIPPTPFVNSLLESLCESNVKSNIELVRSVQRELPLFFNILSTFSIENALPEEFKGLLIYLADKSLVPFKNAQSHLSVPPLEETIYGRFVSHNYFYQKNKIIVNSWQIHNIKLKGISAII